MRIRHHRRFAAALAGLLAAVCPCAAQQGRGDAALQQALAASEQRNQSLQRALAEANRAEQEASRQLAQVRERLEALGRNLLDGGDDRLVQAAADLRIAHERGTKIEDASMSLVTAAQEYIRSAVSSDPEARLRVETAMRELDAALGLREKPRPDVRAGTLQQARIVSIDQESGMLVLNIGESQGARTGMTFRLAHGQQAYGKAILADVRKNVGGLFVESLDNPADTPRVGDLVMLETQAFE
jgi:chromosome segregation ATPase